MKKIIVLVAAILSLASCSVKVSKTNFVVERMSCVSGGEKIVDTVESSEFLAIRNVGDTAIFNHSTGCTIMVCIGKFQASKVIGF